MRNTVRRVMRLQLMHYLAAVMAIAIMGLVRHMLDPVLGEHDSFILFLPAVFLAAWIGGWMPGSLALVLGYLAASFFFLQPRFSLGIDSLEGKIGLVVYFFVGGMSVIQFEVIRRRTAELALVTARQLSREASAREGVEGALQESEDHARLLLDSTAEAIYGIDLQRNCTFANPACAKLLGFTDLRQMLGKNMHALAHHTRRDGTPYPVEECPIYQAIQRGDGCHIEDGLFWRTDGSSFPVEYWSYPIKRGNKTIGAVVTFWDTSEKVQAQEIQRTLAAERDSLLRRLQLQIERMPLAYILFDADFRVVDWNPTAERTFGFAREEMLGTGPPHEKIVPRSFWEKEEELRRRIRAGDMDAHSINENLTKDGRTITCEWFNTPLVDKNGQFVGFLCLARDMTEQKSLEAQYRQAQKMEAVGRLAGGVAHDFNNLLTVINGYSELATQRLPAGDPARAMLQQVVAAGDRATGLTRQLLAFSRKSIIEPKILDLKAVVADVDKMLRHIIGEDIQMTTVGDPEVGAIKADAGQIEQVILNLVVNARDAMPKGGRLTIEVRNAVLDETYVHDHPDAKGGRNVLLAVSDTGCGIDAPTMAKIFDPFFTTKGDQGTGLGLATVHGIVKQSGGHIVVYSEVAHGTTFKVYLPQVEQRPISTKSDQRLKVLPRGSETVLCVEDEDGVRSLSRHALKDFGYTVLEAKDGVEALRVAGQHQGRIDLLVTDVVMPRMGGREIADQLVMKQPGAKVLFLSGYTDDTVVRHGILEAQVSFLQKPFSPASLVLKVREVLDKTTEATP
jgi:two-component system, cell cycle sensor histidine kinase and response regulator CckA